VGSVLEITLRACARDLGWQASLNQAIQSAAPLPSSPFIAISIYRLIDEHSHRFAYGYYT
jgi:hypothetical protein